MSFLFLFLAESVEILVRPLAGFPSADIFVVQTGIYIRYGFHENKENEWTLGLIYVFNVLLVKNISGQKQSPKSMTLYL